MISKEVHSCPNSSLLSYSIENFAELRAASEKISNNDLEFSIEYDSKDELGQLCTSFFSER